MAKEILVGNDADTARIISELDDVAPHPHVVPIPLRLPGEDTISNIPFSHNHVSTSYENNDPEAIDLGNKAPNYSRVFVFAGFVAINGVNHEAVLTIHERPNDITPSIELAIYDTDSL